ncbi:MAG: amidohydrolase family protein [Candidatus Obscuribacterales bacterium]|nr:amidohydrolase family protein [Candidatus Obscuribacterales bacterium]
MVLLLSAGIQIPLVGSYNTCAAEKKQAMPSWAQYKVIDIHTHIGTFRGFDLSSQTLLVNLKARGVKMAFVSNIDCAELPGVTLNLDEKTANSRTVEVVQSHSNLLRGLLWVRPQKNDVALARTFLRTELGKSNKERLFVGMKFHPDMNNFDADDKSVDPFLSLCEEFHIPAVFHCGDNDQHSSAQRIYNAAKRHPNLPIILYHMGFNTEHKDAIACVKAARTRNDANLYLETSQCDFASVLKAIKEVGSSRVLFGSDATYFGKEHYTHYDNLIADLHKNLSAQDFNNVVRVNACRLFAVK